MIFKLWSRQDFVTDRQMERNGQTDRQTSMAKAICLQTLKGRGIITTKKIPLRSYKDGDKTTHQENNCLISPQKHMLWVHIMREPALVAQLDAPSDWRPGGHGFNPCRGRQHSFVETDHDIFSMVILSLLLIQEGQLSVSGKRMCTILVNCLED